MGRVVWGKGHKMKGAWRIRKAIRGFRFAFGAMRYLKNWREMLRASRGNDGSEVETQIPVMEFRTGMKLGLMKGGYGIFKYVFPDIFVDKCYEPTPLFRPRDGWTILDFGANIGCFSCKCGFEYPGARVVSIEPIPEYIDALKANIARNNLANVQVIDGAVCSKPGAMLDLRIWFTQGGELMMCGEHDSSCREETRTVRGYSIGEIFETGRIEKCDLLKMDIEGAEYDVLESFAGEIWGKIDRLVVEVHSDSEARNARLADMLARQGYVVESDGRTGDHILWAYRSTAVPERR